MFGLTGPIVYIIIFVGKLIEVSFMTLRIMFVGKGRKLLGAICSLIEILLWVVIAGTVLTQANDDPLKVVIYCIAFTLGNVMGVVLEGKLAVGLTSMQIVAGAEDGMKIGAELRARGFGVTILDGHSVDGTKRDMIFVQLKRKSIPECEKIVREMSPDAMISLSDVKTVLGGYVR